MLWIPPLLVGHWTNVSATSSVAHGPGCFRWYPMSSVEREIEQAGNAARVSAATRSCSAVTFGRKWSTTTWTYRRLRSVMGSV